MMLNCFYSYTLLPLVAELRESYASAVALLMLLRALVGTEVHGEVVALLLAALLPAGLLDDLPRVPSPEQLFAAKGNVTQSPFVIAQMNLVYERFFENNSDATLNSTLDLTQSQPSISQLELGDAHLEYFTNVARGTGVVPLHSCDKAISDAPLCAPLTVIRQEPTQPNPSLESLLRHLAALERPSLGGLTLLRELLAATQDYSHLKAFGSQAALGRLRQLLENCVRQRATRLVFRELFGLVALLVAKLPETTPGVHDMLLAAFRPVFAFFFEYNLTQGLTKLCLLLEEEFRYVHAPPRCEDGRVLALAFELLSPTAHERELFTLPADEDQRVLRSNVSAFVCFANAFEELFPSAGPRIFQRMYEEFYAKFPELKCRSDQPFPVTDRQLFDIEIKVKENGVTVRKSCCLHLSAASIIIVEPPKGEECEAKLLINIRYKIFRAEVNDRTRIMLSFYSKHNGLLMYFDSPERAQHIYVLLREAQKKVYLKELKFFSRKLQFLKEKLRI